MIQKITFENYKAFIGGEIKIKPITILLGANSVGKSSIIQLLLMLQQTALSEKYRSAFRLHGENVSMGECENIFRNKDVTKDITISFDFNSSTLSDLLKKDLFSDYINRISQPIQYLERFYEKGIWKKIDIETKKYFNRNGEIRREVFQQKDVFFDLLADIQKIKEYLKIERELSNSIFYYSKSILVGDNFTDSVKILYDFFSQAKKTRSNLFSLSFAVKRVCVEDENTLKVSRVTLVQNKKIILSIQFYFASKTGNYVDLDLCSDFVNKDFVDDKTKEEILSAINQHSTIFSLFPDFSDSRDFFYGFFDEKYGILSRVIIQIFSHSMECIKANFAKDLMHHVSPLRAHPKRYYFLDKEEINTSLNTLDGNSLTEILKENKVIREKVNEWLQNFGLQVDVNTLQDVIHKLKIKQNNLDLDITDVGFGISQVLPIIVQGFLSFEQSLTIIEQPEIHLHPKMQADLTDLFIDIVKSKENTQKYLLIETHSEYLLRRLRRRIAENYHGITADDVAIYFISPKSENNSSAIIEEKSVAENGFFEWPKDFYSGELLKDTIEFIKQTSK